MEQQQPQTPVENTVTPSSGGKKKGGLFRILFIIIALVLLGGGAYYFFSSGSFSPGGEVNESPVVATVNDTTITQQDVNDRIERSRDALLAQGTNIDDASIRATVEQQTLTQLVNEALVLEDALRLGIAATNEEIDAEFAKIKERFDTEDKFQAELMKNHFTEDALRANIARELITQKYVQRISDNAQIQVTDEEIAALYAQAKEKNDALPPLEEIRDQVESQIKSQKLSSLVSGAVEELRKQANIVIPDTTSDAK